MNVQELRDIWRRLHGRGTYPHQLAFLLELPLRRLVLSPSRLASRLHLDQSSRVLEVGPGPGFFSVEIARSVTAGRLELFDIQHEMLSKARFKLRRAGATNVGFTQGNAVSLPFADGTFDVVFLVAVLGEVPDPSRCIESIRHTLRPGGILSITELPGDPDALSRDQVGALAGRHGLEPLEILPVWRGFTSNFVAPAREPGSNRSAISLA